MSGLTLRSIKKSYGTVDVIRGVDLAVEPGEFCVFVGPSGCGKSTLLRMIAGLEDISSGDLMIGSQRMNEVDASNRGIAMVFQSYALYPHMTVQENMGFALRFVGLADAEIKARVSRAAETLGLAHLMHRRPKDLSGGQRQRVAIGRAIVRQPEVFLFDEPLSNLDAELRVHMRLEIARLHKEMKATVVYVTHDQVEAMTLADKIVVLRDGRIEQIGSPLELYDNPSNVFVAGFIGTPKMNFLRGKVRGNLVELVDFSGQTLPLPDQVQGVADGSDVTVGLRPDIFRQGGAVGLELKVDLLEHLGGETLVHARHGAAGQSIMTISTDKGRSYRIGDTITIHFAPNRALFFAQDGRRLR